MNVRTYGLVGVLVALLLLAASLYSYARWFQSQYFGRVISVTNETLTISDLRVGERVIRVTPLTIVKKGLSAHAIIRAGDNVVVIGETKGATIEASLIRIIDERVPSRGRK